LQFLTEFNSSTVLVAWIRRQTDAMGGRLSGTSPQAFLVVLALVLRFEQPVKIWHVDHPSIPHLDKHLILLSTILKPMCPHMTQAIDRKCR
jgi:hypothetical protein